MLVKRADLVLLQDRLRVAKKLKSDDLGKKIIHIKNLNVSKFLETKESSLLR